MHIFKIFKFIILREMKVILQNHVPKTVLHILLVIRGHAIFTRLMLKLVNKAVKGTVNPNMINLPIKSNFS